jgi:hypothetical protein
MVTILYGLVAQPFKIDMLFLLVLEYQNSYALWDWPMGAN